MMTPIHALEATSLINIVYEAFQKIQDPRTFSGNSRMRLVDHLMSGLAIFGLKFPSLLNPSSTLCTMRIELKFDGFATTT